MKLIQGLQWLLMGRKSHIRLGIKCCSFSHSWSAWFYFDEMLVVGCMDAITLHSCFLISSSIFLSLFPARDSLFFATGMCVCLEDQLLQYSCLSWDSVVKQESLISNFLNNMRSNDCSLLLSYMIVCYHCLNKYPPQIPVMERCSHIKASAQPEEAGEEDWQTCLIAFRHLSLSLCISPSASKLACSGCCVEWVVSEQTQEKRERETRLTRKPRAVWKTRPKGMREETPGLSSHSVIQYRNSDGIKLLRKKRGWEERWVTPLNLQQKKRRRPCYVHSHPDVSPVEVPSLHLFFFCSFFLSSFVMYPHPLPLIYPSSESVTHVPLTAWYEKRANLTNTCCNGLSLRMMLFTHEHNQSEHNKRREKNRQT